MQNLSCTALSQQFVANLPKLMEIAFEYFRDRMKFKDVMRWFRYSKKNEIFKDRNSISFFLCKITTKLSTTHSKENTQKLPYFSGRADTNRRFRSNSNGSHTFVGAVLGDNVFDFALTILYIHFEFEE